jgi:hypothetical protein
MARQWISRAVVSVTLAAALVAWGANPALTAPSAPANDGVRNATVIGSLLPYLSDPIDVTNAGSGGEPQPSCARLSHTVWWTVTPATTATVTADTLFSEVDTVLAVYTRTGNAFTEVGCNDNITGGNLRSEVFFGAAAGTTYYIQVGLCCSDKSNASTPPGKVVLKLH